MYMPVWISSLWACDNHDVSRCCACRTRQYSGTTTNVPAQCLPSLCTLPAL